MTPTVLQADVGSSRRRTRVTMAASILLHAVLLLLLLTIKTPVRETPVTEITWLEPGDAAAADAAGAPEAPLSTSAPTAAQVGAPEEQRFRRAAVRATTAPVPQSDVALDDRMSARLAALQSSAPADPVTARGPGGAGALLGGPPEPARGDGGAAPIALRRGGPGGDPGHALALTRGGGGGLGVALAPATAPTRAPEAAQSRVEEATAHSALAGAQLLGPVADRPIVHVVTPVYPAWAKHDAVEGAVTLYFVVRADGSVRENVLVQKTAGFEDFDENARSALREWRFAALAGGRTGDQWGTITFQYRLRD